MNIMRCRSDRIFFRVFFVPVRCPVLLWSLPVFFFCRGCPLRGRAMAVSKSPAMLRMGAFCPFRALMLTGSEPPRGGLLSLTLLHHPIIHLRHCRGYSVYQYTQTAYAVQYCTDVLTENLQIPCDLFAATLQSVNCTRTPLGTKPRHTAFRHGFFRRGCPFRSRVSTPTGSTVRVSGFARMKPMRFRFFLTLSQWGVRIGRKKKLETEIMRARIGSLFGYSLLT